MENTQEKCGQLARRKGSQFFKVQEIHLYYTGGMFSINVRLAIDPSKISEADRRLAGSASDYDINLHPFLLAWKDDFCNT